MRICFLSAPARKSQARVHGRVLLPQAAGSLHMSFMFSG
ncbi:MAG: hypothetical protein JWM19_3853 [Actinomycetia bacterium]|nr:hypothetical protein [Actinomycetes bacterium]